MLTKNGQVRGVRNSAPSKLRPLGEEQLQQAPPLIQRGLDPQATRVGHQAFGERASIRAVRSMSSSSISASWRRRSSPRVRPLR